MASRGLLGKVDIGGLIGSCETASQRIVRNAIEGQRSGGNTAGVTGEHCLVDAIDPHAGLEGGSDAQR
jgi:hypothetical protein